MPKILLYALSAFLVYKFVILPFDYKAIGPAVFNLKPVYIFLGFACAAFMLFAEAFTMKRYLKLIGAKASFKQCLVFTAVGNFFSSVTPAATGGQPMQLYYMHKNNISTEKGTLALLMDLGAYQAAVAIMAIIGYGVYFKEINLQLGKLLPLVWLGFGLNFALMAFIFTAIFNNKLIYKLVGIIGKVIGIFSVQRQKSFMQNALGWAEKYKQSANFIKKNIPAYLVNIAFTVLRIIAMHSAPFWIYKALGLNGYSFLHILLLQSVLYISCASLPLPGGMGIGESMFLLYFKNAFSAGILNLACILSRLIGFYSVVILCGAVIGAIGILSKHKYSCKRKLPS